MLEPNATAESVTLDVTQHGADPQDEPARAAFYYDFTSPEAYLAAARELGERAAPFALDVTDRARLLALPAEVDAHFGRLDFIVNNAGVNYRGSVRDRSRGSM